MNAKRNKEKMTPFPRKKAQGSLEYILMAAGVLIVVIVFIALYMHSASNTKLGNAESIVAAGSSADTELTLALSEPLPTNAGSITITTSGNVPLGTITGPTGPVYTNNYPEYVFTTTATNSITVDNVTSMSYQLNGQTITVSTGTGSPLPIQPISSANVVTP